MTSTEPGASGRRQPAPSELNRLAPLLKGEALSPRVAEELNALIQGYLRGEAQKEQPRQPSQGWGENAELRELEKAAAALSGMLTALREEEVERMAAASSTAAAQMQQTLASAAVRLGEIADASRKAVAAARRDAAASDPLKDLIVALVPIFERETGTEAGNSWHPIRNAYFSPFFDFVKGLLDVVAPSEALNNKALGSHITRALMAAREMKGNYLARTHGQPRVFKPLKRR